MFLKTLRQIFFIILSIFYGTLLVLLILECFKTPKFLIQTDLVSFLTGAKIVKDGKTNLLYDIKLQTLTQNQVVYPDTKLLLPYRNLPIVAVLYIPLLSMSLIDSYLLVLLINLFFLFLFHTFFTKYLEIKRLKYLFLLPILFYPSISGLIVGQYTSLAILIFLFIYILTREQKAFWAGLVCSFLVIKPQYLLFVPFPFMLVNKKKFYILGFVTGLSIFILLNILVAKNLQPFYDYPSFIMATENSSFGSRPYQMSTLYGLFKTTWPQTNSNFLIIGNFVLYFFIGFLVVAKLIKSKNKEKIFISGFFLTILFSVHSLTHDLAVFLVPLYLYIARDLSNVNRVVILCLITGVICLLQANIFVILLILIVFLLMLYDKDPYAPHHHKDKLQGN